MSSDETYTIRPARAEERAAAAALTLAAYEQYAGLMPPSGWAALREAVVAALAAPGPFDHFVAERAGSLVGSVLLFPASGGDSAGAGGRMPWPELRLLAVAASERGQGVGAALVRACVARVRAAGEPVLGLYTSDSMRAAIALYERLGFRRAAGHDFWPSGGSELVKAYRLDLVAPE